MYSKIYNPLTKRYNNISTITGKKLLAAYIKSFLDQKGGNCTKTGLGKDIQQIQIMLDELLGKHCKSNKNPLELLDHVNLLEDKIPEEEYGDDNKENDYELGEEYDVYNDDGLGEDDDDEEDDDDDYDDEDYEEEDDDDDDEDDEEEDDDDDEESKENEPDNKDDLDYEYARLGRFSVIREPNYTEVFDIEDHDEPEQTTNYALSRFKVISNPEYEDVEYTDEAYDYDD